MRRPSMVQGHTLVHFRHRLKSDSTHPCAMSLPPYQPLKRVSAESLLLQFFEIYFRTVSPFALPTSRPHLANRTVLRTTSVLEPNQPLVLFGVGRSVDSLDSSDGAADPGA